MIFELILFAAAGASQPGAVTPSGFEGASIVDEATLAKSTAREDVNQMANSEQTAEVSSSSVSGNVETGTAAFSDNAFQNVSGLTVVNANTGNNVAINGSIVVNVSLSPGP